MQDENSPVVTIKATLTEYTFIQFCRKMGFGTLKLEIMNGQPKKVTQPLKAFRFDLTPDGNPIARLSVSSIDKMVEEINEMELELDNDEE